MKKRMLLVLVVFILIASILATCLVGCKPQDDGPIGCVSHIDINGDGKCDNCGVSMGSSKHDCAVDGHEDADENGVCDVCGDVISGGEDVGIADSFDYVDPSTCEHVDSDGNCVCDICKQGFAHEDSNKDGVCDVCHNKLRDMSLNQTYNDAFSTAATLWNVHRYQTEDDSYPIDYINVGLYDFFFTGDKKGYEIWPVMAAAYPEDVTESVKKDAFWSTVIPKDAKDSYAYKIRLNTNAKWSDGKVINADTYVESFKLLMDPDLKNYRANDQMSGNMVIYGCEDYYYSKDEVIYVGLSDLDFKSIEEALESDLELYINCWDFWGAEGYVDSDGNVAPQWVSITDTTVYDCAEGWADEDESDAFSGSSLFNDWGGYLTLDDMASPKTNENMGWSFDHVGIFKSGEYDFTIVLEKPLKGFYLLYSLASNWIVDVEAYKALIHSDPVTGELLNDYNTSLETSHGYGPYKLTAIDSTTMVFERDNNWWGYQDCRFDALYHTSKIYARKMDEAKQRKESFLNGDLMGYGLQSDDYEQFGNSQFLYKSPGTTLFFLVLSANKSALEDAQHDKVNVNKTILVRDDFREALSLTFDKAKFVSEVSPARSPAYSVIGAYDIWNPTTGEKYRDTEIAKKALAEYYGFSARKETVNGVEIVYYSVDGSDVKYTLDQAVASITGYNPELAKQKFLAAYEAELEAGLIDADDVIEIEYSISAASAFMTKTINALNDCINAILKDTVLENRVKIVESTPLAEEWSTALKSGKTQCSLCGWKGGALDPFNSLLYYLEPGHDPYAGGYWKTDTIDATISLPVGEDGAMVDITMKLDDWSKCLTGDPMEIGGVSYNFGYQQCDDSIRLTIMAELEKIILNSFYYIPMMQDGGASLLSQKVSFVLGRDEYNAVLGRGGLTYMTYNYTDEEWEQVKTTMKY